MSDLSHLPRTYVDGFHYLSCVEKLKYYQLGKTGLEVSQIGFGASAVGGTHGKTDNEISIQVIRDAIRKGINYIDTAPWYGDGKSEEVLGKALEGIPRKAYYIATKVGRYKPNVEEMFDFSAKRTLQSINESLERLQLDYVDVIQVHDVEFAPNLDIILQETIPTLYQIKQSGKVRFIGITGYPLSTLKEIVCRSKIKIDTVLSYCRCTLFDNALLDLVHFFQEKDIGLINGAILGMGLLTNKGPQSWHPAGEEIKNTCKQAALYCKKMNVDIAKLGLHFSLTQLGPQTHLVSFAEPKLLQENLNATINDLTDLEKSVLDYIMAKFVQSNMNIVSSMYHILYLRRFFNPLCVHHWEQKEVNEYRCKIKKLKQK